MSDRRSFLRTSIIQTGTRAGGAGGAGTISFPTSYSGTPHVQLQRLAGSRSFGRAFPVSVISRYSGSFTYRVSGSGGTLSWMAVGNLGRQSV